MEDYQEIKNAYYNMGLCHFNLENYEKAKENYQNAVEIQTKKLEENPQLIISLYNSIASCCKNQKQYQQARDAYQNIINLLGADHPDIVPYNQQIGICYFNEKNYQEALKYCIKTSEISNSLLGEFHENTAISHQNIGLCYIQLKEYNNALNSLQKALTIRKTNENKPAIINTYRDLADTYTLMNDLENKSKYAALADELEGNKTTQPSSQPNH